MFCHSCGLSLIKSAKYCHNCGKTVKRENDATSSSSTSTNSQHVKPNKPMSLSDFHSMREEARRATFTYKDAKKKKVAEQDVTIQVAGIMCGRDLKVKKGSNLPLKVSSNITAQALLSVAVEKHSRFNKDLVKYIVGNDGGYKLLYPDKSVVDTLPGVPEAFTLSRYKEELGKSYARIVFYLCHLKDYTSTQLTLLGTVLKVEDDDNDDEIIESEIPTIMVMDESSSNTVVESGDRLGSRTTKPTENLHNSHGEKVQCPSCNLFFEYSDIERHADSCAENKSNRNEVIEQFYQDGDFQAIMNENNPKEVSSALDHSNELSVEDVIRETSRNLSTAVAMQNQCKKR